MAFNYSQVTAITHDLIKDDLSIGIFKSNKFLNYLRMDQDVEDGGNKIICPLMVVDDTGSTGQFYSPRDALTLDEYDGISASEYDWKYLTESVVIYKADIAKNAGKLGVLKLISSKVKQAELAFKQRMVKGALSDGTAATGALSSKQFTGLDKVIAASGTLGSISPADLATWVSYVSDNGGAGRAMTKTLADDAYDQAVEEGIGGPTIGIMQKAMFTQFKGILEANQRTATDDSLDGQGHKGQTLIYNGIKHFIENNMPNTAAGDGQLWYVDTKHFVLTVQKDNNFRRQSIKDLETADALLERLFLYANTVTKERKFHSRLTDITI